jgi:hypothetical protein
MLYQDPLNPKLYEALERSFRSVEISNAGVPRRVAHLPDWQHAGRLRVVEIDSGEFYRISCPYCKETRQRLYINHEWGEVDPETGWQNLHLAYCFNEQDCLMSEARQRELYHRVYPLGRSRLRSAKAPQPPAVALPPVPREFSLPEGLIPIHELPRDHPAADYWQKRGFDLQELGHWWHVAYCERCLTTSPSIYKRVVIPIYELQTSIKDGQTTQRLAGWQARLIQEADPQTPKYLTCRGMQKAQLLYNLPHAIEIPGPVFVCEGVADVWKVGPAAVALLGKSLSARQETLLTTCFEQRPIVVLLDVDAGEDAKKIVKALRTARHASRGDSRVVQAILPPGRKDPGDCTREEIFQAAQVALLTHQSPQEKARVYPSALSDQRDEEEQDSFVPHDLEQLSIAAHLLDENAPYDLRSLTKRFLPDQEVPAATDSTTPKVAQATNEAPFIPRIWHQGRIKEQLVAQGLEFLYREIELPTLVPLAAMMRNGVLFDVATLQAHRDKYPTQVDSLQKHLSNTGRIHPKLDPISCSTGRILCSNPNLQGLPIDLRDAVVAQEGHLLLAADLSQFELRILAHFTQEPAFVQVYQGGHGDLHRFTAARLLDLPLEQITEEERKLGKTVNFSLVNGQTEIGLAKKLQISVPDAATFIQDFQSRYPLVASWIDRTIQATREQGYVTSLYGRRRHLPSLNSENAFQVDRAERQVVSGIIQATGADIFKWMLCRLYRNLPPEFKMLLAIHDAILFEIPEKRIEEARKTIEEIMQVGPRSFSVPLAVNIRAGKNWKECQG